MFVEVLLAQDDPREWLEGKTIAVLYGGPGEEREVSLESGQMVARGLSELGYNVWKLDVRGPSDLEPLRRLGVDLAFLALHGCFGEDGQVQRILDAWDVPYTGSGPDASARAFHKGEARQVFHAHGLPIAPGLVVRPQTWREQLAAARWQLQLDAPIVVKPAASGSSLGVTILKDWRNLALALDRAFHYGPAVVVEKFIPGREITAGIFADQPLPLCEIRPKQGFYDYQAKYQDDATRIQCPADLPRATADRIKALALAAHQALDCREYSRTDFILDPVGQPWILETNTLPGMTSHSLLPRAARAAGLEFPKFCEALAALALKRSRPVLELASA
jgi:D-alanine-D-alanine ligase